MRIRQIFEKCLTSNCNKEYNICRCRHRIAPMPTGNTRTVQEFLEQALIPARLSSVTWLLDLSNSSNPPCQKLNKPCRSSGYMGNLRFLHIFLPKDRNLGYSKAISLYNILKSKYSSLLHKLAVFLLALSLSVTAQADDIGDSMSEFWNDMGGASNATSGGPYEGQAAGYYSLGNVFARSKIKNKNFVSLQMPSHRAGCGGIDMFAGSFSYINADELISLFNSISSNAGAFAFKLGLETLSPQIAEWSSYTLVDK